VIEFHITRINSSDIRVNMLSLDDVLDDILSLFNDSLGVLKSEPQLVKEVSRISFLLLLFVHGSVPVRTIAFESAYGVQFDSVITKFTNR
jgi:hypothetical protein